jgi:hypothetical protein
LLLRQTVFLAQPPNDSAKLGRFRASNLSMDHPCMLTM